MANLVARVLEKRIAHIFTNFQPGKNATSSLLKGEGTAKDLEFNKTFINSYLPLNYTAISATCKKMQWYVSVMSLGKSGKDPIVVVVTGVTIVIQQLPPHQVRTAWKDKKKKRSKGKEQMRVKRNAIIQGIKVQASDLCVKVQLLNDNDGASSLPSPPAFLQFEMGSVRVTSTNSQWQEVNDINKVYVINGVTNEALSFKKIEITGCGIRFWHPLSKRTQGGGEARKLFEGMSIHCKFSTKRRCQDWKMQSFKVELEIPQVSSSLSRTEVMMLKAIAAALQTVKKSKTDDLHAQTFSSNSLSDMAEEAAEEEAEEEAVESQESMDADSLDSLLESQARWSDSDAKWCPYIDNSIELLVREVQVSVHKEEEAEGGGSRRKREEEEEEEEFLALLTGMHVRFWPAQKSKTSLPSRTDNILELVVRLFTLKQSNAEEDKLLPHLSLVKPSTDQEDAADSFQDVLSLSAQWPSRQGKGAAYGASSPPSVKIQLAPLVVVWDAPAWMTLVRTFLSQDVSQRLAKHDLLLSSQQGDKKKKDRKKNDLSFHLETRSLSVLLPVYRQEQENGDSSLCVTELRMDINDLSVSFLPSSKLEGLTAGGLQEIRSPSFPWAPGDSREVTSLQAFQSTVDVTRVEVGSVSLSCAEEEEAFARELLSVQESRIVLLQNRRWNGEGSLPPEEKRLHVEVRRGVQAELRAEDSLLLSSLWDNFRNNAVTRAMREEEAEVKQMLLALQAAHLGATSYNNSRRGTEQPQEVKGKKIALLSVRMNGILPLPSSSTPSSSLPPPPPPSPPPAPAPSTSPPPAPCPCTSPSPCPSPPPLRLHHRHRLPSSLDHTQTLYFQISLFLFSAAQMKNFASPLASSTPSWRAPPPPPTSNFCARTYPSPLAAVGRGPGGGEEVYCAGWRGGRSGGGRSKRCWSWCMSTA
eukprot:500509-Hanusia_phi.AAC.5